MLYPIFWPLGVFFPFRCPCRRLPSIRDRLDPRPRRHRTPTPWNPIPVTRSPLPVKFLTISFNKLFFFVIFSSFQASIFIKVMWKVDITSHFSWTTFRRNSTRKIVRWFEELINLNHLTNFITEFHQKLVEKLSKKIQLSLSRLSLFGRYLTLP